MRFFLNGKEISEQEQAGLGNKIAVVAEPIAKVFDTILGTKIAGCKGCKKMRQRLNEGMTITAAVKLRIKGE